MAGLTAFPNPLPSIGWEAPCFLTLQKRGKYARTDLVAHMPHTTHARSIEGEQRKKNECFPPPPSIVLRPSFFYLWGKVWGGGGSHPRVEEPRLAPLSRMQVSLTLPIGPLPGAVSGRESFTQFPCRCTRQTSQSSLFSRMSPHHHIIVSTQSFTCVQNWHQRLVYGFLSIWETQEWVRKNEVGSCCLS